jgi:hypothetical protein
LRFNVDELSRLLALYGLAMIVSNGVLVPLLARFLPEKPLVVMALLAQAMQVHVQRCRSVLLSGRKHWPKLSYEM